MLEERVPVLLQRFKAEQENSKKLEGHIHALSHRHFTGNIE